MYSSRITPEPRFQFTHNCLGLYDSSAEFLSHHMQCEVIKNAHIIGWDFDLAHFLPES